MKRLIATTTFALLATSAFAFEKKAQQLHDSSQATLDQLMVLRDSGRLNNNTALQLIQEVLSPEFDFKYLATSVMARSWGDASAAQQQQIAELFQKMIERTYSKSLAKFSSQQLEFLDPVQRKNMVSVAMNVVQGSKKVKLEYVVKEAEGEWKIADLKIENVSLVSNFRRQFKSVIRKNGIDGLIKLLESRS